MADIAINPSSLVVDGAIVSTANPLPVSNVAAGSGTTDISINPRALIVNGALVSDANPLPITLV